jgi:hypothetical protein
MLRKWIVTIAPWLKIVPAILLAIAVLDSAVGRSIECSRGTFWGSP